MPLLSSERLGKPLPERVVIVRALPGLGDLLCAVPALRALRGALPAAHVTLVGLPWARAFVARFDRYLDGFLEFPGFPGIPERAVDPSRLAAFVASVQRRPFDLAIQMHGSGLVSNSFTARLGARLNAGFFLPGLYCPDPDRFLPYPAHEPEVRRHLQLMEFLGAPSRGEDLEFPLRAEDAAALAAVAETGELRPRAYACLHPGARLATRRWPAERFALVGDELARRGLRVVLTGTRVEASITRAVRRAMHAPPIDLTGRTSVGALAALVRDAAVVVSNDTGVSHVAAATGTPSVVVFMVTDPARWAPLDRRLHRPVGRRLRGNPCEHGPGLAVHRCLRDGCTAQDRALGEPEAADVAPDAVLAEVARLLSTEYADAA